ncbi:DUF4935 domain-containing protein [Mucilaginibacter sp. BJC16-A38]|uniref:PIN domain-containing protein n=1 Tax=Mucilaginibacter phenanthrenivorans TaxID=1234842 RepID=UPI00215815AC|nr:PIN domain-containing protein [Mucilaginibacter phenanthrenivorans]MCR8557743.1 DUF4935 domain-containing protein [Mucilaginibacter phenanthrenivorans]
MSAPIRNIVLDTSFIEKQNFLGGKAMTELKKMSRKGWANLFMTDINYREVFSRFRKRLSPEVEKTRNIQNQIAKDLRVLKNSPAYDAYSKLPSIDLDQVCADFQVKFDQYVKEAKMKIIKTGHLTIEKIMDDYFKSTAPFGGGEKKSEFPDAFSYLATKEYFEKIGDKCYLVTGDKDFDDLPKEIVQPIENAAIALDAIIRFEEEKSSKAPEFINLMFERDKKKIKERAKKMIADYIEKEVWHLGEINGMEVDTMEHLDLSDIDITDFSIISLGDGEATLECSANFAYEIDIAVDDKSEAWYDKEDDRWHFVEHSTFTVKDSQEVKLSVVVEFDEDLEDADLEVDTINDGNWFPIFDRGRHHHDDY